MDKENIKRGAFLKTLRENALYTERDLAELIGVEPSDVTVWETGIKFPEDNIIIEKLAKILNVSKREILNGEYNKKSKDTDKYAELDYVEDDSENKEVTNNMKKTVALVVLACVVLFVFIIALAALTRPSTGTDEVYYVASDVREPIVHKPHVKNEHIIYNTQVLSSNTANDRTSELVKYSFIYQDGKYVKATSNYRIEYYDSTFYLTIYGKNRTFYAEENVFKKLIKHTSSNKTKTVEVEITPPYGSVNCDTYICESNADYY
ncbi:MAG: helix-turn-helix domain-containing protein, partial [Bacilli bacterium]|nr:helix-turn-helix domain-containing protein [Bacilli bacterium]